MDHPGVKPCDCLPVVSDKSRFYLMLLHIHDLKFSAVHSYSNDHCIKSFVRNWKIIFSKRRNITIYCFFNICYCFFFCLSLTNTARQTWTFCDEISVFARINNDLSHISPHYGTRYTALRLPCASNRRAFSPELHTASARPQ
jgi:hypothetical protein